MLDFVSSIEILVLLLIKMAKYKELLEILNNIKHEIGEIRQKVEKIESSGNEIVPSAGKDCRIQFSMTTKDELMQFERIL